MGFLCIDFRAHCVSANFVMDRSNIFPFLSRAAYIEYLYENKEPIYLHSVFMGWGGWGGGGGGGEGFIIYSYLKLGFW